jgi:hypothetical protein
MCARPLLLDIASYYAPLTHFIWANRLDKSMLL